MLKNKLSNFDKVSHDDGLIIWYEKESEEIVCLVSLKPQQGQIWICGLYVSEKYRGSGICRSLLDYATFNGGTHLSARASSRAAEIYKHYGFVTYDADDKFLYMSVNTCQESLSALKAGDTP